MGGASLRRGATEHQLEKRETNVKSKIQEFVENAQGEFSCRSYSGRAMYGESCLGVDIESAGVGALMALIVDGIEELVDTDSLEPDDLAGIAAALRSMRTDQMGMGTIAYFPGVTYVAAATQSDRTRLLVESFDRVLGTWSPEDETSVDDFAVANADMSDTDLADLVNLKIGQQLNFGGGAAPQFRVTRIA